jgi:hypothetical protein
MTSLLISPYNLVRGDNIIVKVRAYNSRGWGAMSATSATGITVQTVPDQMVAPTRVSSTSTSIIVVAWTALTFVDLATTPNDGGVPITSYLLEWDAGTSGSTWSSLIGSSPDSLALTYSATGGSSGLTAGAIY